MGESSGLSRLALEERLNHDDGNKCSEHRLPH